MTDSQSDAVMRQAVAETLGELGDESRELFLQSLADIIAHMSEDDLLDLSTHLARRMPSVAEAMRDRAWWLYGCKDVPCAL